MNHFDEEPKPITNLKIRMMRKRFSKVLGMVALQDLIALIWHLDRVQSDRYTSNTFFVDLPPDALTKDFGSPYFVFKWYLETLLSEFFVTRPRKINPKGKNRFLNPQQWNTVVLLINLNQDIEDSESAVRLKKSDIFLELHRIAQRQFPWQRGLVSKRILYRYLSIYRNSETLRRFKESHGISLDDYLLVGFALWTSLRLSPRVSATLDMKILGVKDKDRDRAIAILSDSAETADEFYSECRRKPLVAHLPSRLRTHPLLMFTNGRKLELVAPLVDLVLQRVTSGLAYDFFEFDDLKEGIANGFVDYVVDYIRSGKNAFEVNTEVRYKRGKHWVMSPDILVSLEEDLSIVIECKARRMSHTAQFATDPLTDAKQGFTELAKGVAQLWRYSLDASSGIVEENWVPSKDAVFVLLTLDGWLDSSEVTQRHVLALAHELADQKKIPIEHRVDITFASVEDLEHMVAKGDSNQIITSLKAQKSDKYAHWSVQSIFEDKYKDAVWQDLISSEKLLCVAPWFDKISKRQQS